MGLWNGYFIAKLGLFYADYIDFNVLLNLALALILMLPLQRTAWRVGRFLLAVPAAIALFYGDTRLPPFSRLLAQQQNLEQFSLSYAVELISRFINPNVVLMGIGLLFVTFVAARKLRMTTFVLLAIWPAIPLYSAWQNNQEVTQKDPTAAIANTRAIPLGIAPTDASGKPNDAAIDAALNAFYNTQARRQVSFLRPESPPAFDVLIVQICSLAWDDLIVTEQAQSPLLRHTDILFKQFNTATAYSGPAAIRLLRSTCGQTSHEALYMPAAANCYLFNQFEQAGFSKHMLLNHDGVFGDMLKEIQQYGGLNITPDANMPASTQWLGFDGSSIKNDYEVLNGWLTRHPHNPNSPVALYYNTTSLHDGNHPPGTSSSQGSASQYGTRVKRLMSDLDKLITTLEAQQRPALLVMIPEHGAGARGDRMQIPFMRENPSPAITLAPVALRFIGLPKQPQTITIDQPSSYIDLAGLLRDVIAQDPYRNPGVTAASLAANMTSTPYVSSNEAVTVVRYSDSFYLRYQDGAWADYRYQ
ncbi:MAG: cellulose biosynthesis protein BcsG [Paraperlucidibaca sp.]